MAPPKTTHYILPGYGHSGAQQYAATGEGDGRAEGWRGDETEGQENTDALHTLLRGPFALRACGPYYPPYACWSYCPRTCASLTAPVRVRGPYYPGTRARVI